MHYLPINQDDNLLSDIRAALISAQHQFREQICHDLEWSYRLFYEMAAQVKDYNYQESLTMLRLFARIIETLESILIAMCTENGLVYGVQVMVNWYKKE
jgi:hypothetical protein